MKRRAFILSGCSAALFGVMKSDGYAQSSYPNRTVKVIAPVNPGGGVDLVARTVSEQLAKSLKQSFVVENISGGGGIVGSMVVKRAAPDGYTLFLSYVGTHGTNPAVRKLPYDAMSDYTHIAMIAGTPNILVVPASTPASNMKEFLAYAKQNVGKLSYGSAGTGTLTHLAMEQLKLAAGFFMTHVPYRGIGPALTDTMGGQTQAMMPGLAAAIPHIRSGRIKPIAITGRRRHSLLPNVPTLDELGFKGFDGVQWYGISGPAKMPSDIVNLLNTEINRTIAIDEVKKKLSIEALETMPMSPVEYSKFIQDDIARWARVSKERNIVIEGDS
ncbi:MAG: Bug family tripartite tricarboxylate transporter substrate binding protein [Burkholderiaceae bacterium]